MKPTVETVGYVVCYKLIGNGLICGALLCQLLFSRFYQPEILYLLSQQIALGSQDHSER